MASTTIMRPVGPTIALALTTTAHAAVPLLFSTNDQVNFVALQNIGSASIAVKISQSGALAQFPVDGTPGDLVLSANMTSPVNVSIPASAPQVSAVASAGTSTLYATPIGDQS